MTSSNMKVYGALLVILATTVGPAAYLRHRHDVRAALLDNAGQRLATVPDQFESWLLREEESLTKSALNLLGCSHYLCRTYVNSETGEVVALVLLAGPAGPLVVHTPEICMTSREYENLKPAEQFEISAHGKSHGFFATMFRAKTLEGQKVNVYYGWSRDGQQWEAPDSPRVELGPLPILYKLQVASSEPAPSGDGPTAAMAFLNDLLPFLTLERSATN